MLTKQIAPTLKSLAVTLLLLCSFTITAQNSRAAMEAAYKTFIGALKAQDAAKLKNAMSAEAWMKMKNRMTSAKMEFPKTFFGSAADLELDLAKLEFLKAPDNGPTGNLVYYDRKKGNAIILRFIKETGAWKFSEMESYGTAELSKKIKAKNFSFLEEKKFKPDGIAPAVQPEIKNVDYVAMLDRSGDYKISIRINSIEQESSNGGSKSGLLMGGVKKGTNTIEITLSPMDAGGGSISVSVRAIINGAPKEVFVLKEAKPGTIIKKEFEVE